MDHLNIGGENTYIIANAKGYLCVIGTMDMKKQEKNVDDIR